MGFEDAGANGTSSTIAYRAADALFRHARLFIGSSLGVALTVAAVIFARPTTYTAGASTQVVVETELTSALGYHNTSWISPAQQNVDRFGDLMRDDLPGGFVDALLRRASLNKPINVDPRVHDARLDDLRKHLWATPTSNEVFSITLVWDDAGECERIVKAAQDQYIEETGLSRQASSLSTAQFLDTQIQDYRKRMQAAEQALITFKQSHLGQSPEAAQAELARLAQLKTERDYLDITAHDNDLRRQALEQRLSQIKPVNILEQTVKQSPITQQIETLQGRRAVLLAQDYRVDSDAVRNMDDQIARLEKQRRQQAATSSQSGSISETKLQNNPEYQDLSQQLTEAVIAQRTQQARMTLLDQQIASYEARAQRLPAAERELTEKMRDQDILKKQFEDLLTRREQAKIKANVDRVAASSTLQPLGSVTSEPTTGKKKKIILIVAGFMVGLFSGTLFVLAHEWMDITVRYPEDAERLLGLPTLAALPDSPSAAALLLPPTLGDGPRGRRQRGLKSVADTPNALPSATAESKPSPTRSRPWVPAAAAKEAIEQESGAQSQHHTPSPHYVPLAVETDA